MIERRLVKPEGIRAAFDSVIGELYRYPALDETRYRSDVESFLAQIGDAP